MPIYNPVSDADKVDGCDAGVATGDVFKIPAGIAQGDIFYVDASGNVVRLAAGTSGHFLKTQGAAANPIWAAGVGGVTTWLALTDTPGSFDNGKLVKSGAAALAFGMLESDIFKKDGSVAMTGDLDMGNYTLLGTSVNPNGDSGDLRIIGGSGACNPEIRLYGKNHLSNAGLMKFGVPNAAKSALLNVLDIDGVTDSPIVNWYYPIKIDTINEKTINAGVTVDNCLIKDGEAADSDKVDGEHASAIVTNARVKAHFPDTIANILSDHNKAAHDTLNIDADTLDGLNSLDFVKKDGTVVMTGDLDIGAGNKIKTATISERTVGGDILFDGSGDAIFGTSLAIKANNIYANFISERTTAAGVQIDNCLIKDGKAEDSDKVDGCDADVGNGDVFKIPSIARGDVITTTSGFPTELTILTYGTSGYQLTTHGSGAEITWSAASDLLFSEQKCAKCGKKFKVGENIVLKVIEFNEVGDTVTIPIHSECAEQPLKKIMLERKVEEDYWAWDEIGGKKTKKRKLKMEKKIITKKKIKESYELDSDIGNFWKMKWQLKKSYYYDEATDKYYDLENNEVNKHEAMEKIKVKKATIVEATEDIKEEIEKAVYEEKEFAI